MLAIRSFNEAIATYFKLGNVTYPIYKNPFLHEIKEIFDSIGSVHFRNNARFVLFKKSGVITAYAWNPNILHYTIASFMKWNYKDDPHALWGISTGTRRGKLLAYDTTPGASIRRGSEEYQLILEEDWTNKYVDVEDAIKDALKVS